MTDYRPDSFLELLGALCLAICSLFEKIRGHATRILAILLVLAMALFADHGAMYFAAVFIVATAVTEIEFLQTLAAIIRGSEPYFRYKAELLTQEETEEKIRQKQVALQPETISVPRATPGGVARALVVEQLTIVRLEKELGTRIERGVRFRKDRRAVEVDGIAKGRRGERDKIIEIKWLRRGGLRRLLDQIPFLLRTVLEYQENTGRDAYLVLAVVMPSRDDATEREVDDVRSRLRATQENWTLYAFSYEDIGFRIGEADA